MRKGGVISILMSNSVLTEDQLCAIGNVAVESTYCEYLVEDIIWSLCGLEENQGKILTDRVLLASRLELMGNLWKPVLVGEKLEKITAIISDLKQANQDRNMIIYGY